MIWKYMFYLWRPGTNNTSRFWNCTAVWPAALSASTVTTQLKGYDTGQVVSMLAGSLQFMKIGWKISTKSP